MFKTEILDSDVLIEDACALLYSTYIEQAQWHFAADNPSEIRIEKRNGKNLLVDRFTNTSRWFGVFDGEKLIGCARLHGLDQTGHYEIEGYANSHVISSYLPRKNCMEMGKVAVSSAYKGCRIINLIYLSVFEYCQRNRYSVFGGVANQYINSLFHRIKLLPTVEQAFKYEETDPFPVNFYFVDYERGDYKTIIPNLRTTITPDDKKTFYSVLDALEILAPLLPVPAYWMGQDGKVLGANGLCLKSMGATHENVVGKTPYDFYKKEIADHILKHNELVMQTEQIMEQDESVNNLTTGEIIHAKALKVPLYDDNGNVIGIIGTSIDLTAEKRAEQLKLETERQEIALIEKEKFILLARKFAHDIASPLTILKILAPSFNNILETQGKVFNSALENLLHTADHLLKTYRNAETAPINDIEVKKPIIVFDHIKQIVEEKKIQYHDREILFDLQATDDAREVTANLQIGQFRRALSNLLNNAVDAIDKKGVVNVHLRVDTTSLIITINDTGNGMPEHVKQKILAGQRVTENKEHGNGMGMQQVWDMLNQNGGTMQIRSENNFGTIIQITFSR